MTMLGAAMAEPRTPSFTGIGSAREWTEIDYKVKPIRFKLVGKTITTEKEYKKAIKGLAKATGFKKKDLRAAVCRQLHNEYTPAELSKNMTPALEHALSGDS